MGLRYDSSKETVTHNRAHSSRFMGKIQKRIYLNSSTMYSDILNRKLIECLQIADKHQINVNMIHLKNGWLVWYDAGRGNQPFIFTLSPGRLLRLGLFL